MLHIDEVYYIISICMFIHVCLIVSIPVYRSKTWKLCLINALITKSSHLYNDNFLYQISFKAYNYKNTTEW